MTRNPKVDNATLEREYVYSTEDISLSQLAEKFDLDRSGIAQKASAGKWYEKRKAYRRQVDLNVVEALGEKWAKHGVVLREQVLEAASKTMTAYIKALEDGEIKPDAKDATLMANVIRTTLADIEAAARPNAMIINGETVEMTEAKAIEAVALAREALGRLQIEAGEVPDDDSPSNGTS